MSNDEFQKVVLEKLTNLEQGQRGLEEGFKSLERRQESLEEGQQSLLKSLNAVVEQTANLTEFKEEVTGDLKSIKENINKIIIVTAGNWSDLAKIKSII